VGQKRLEKAITQFTTNNNNEVSVIWKPYQIDPRTKMEGETMEGYCKRRWGGSGWTHDLKSEGRKDGATFSDWKYWPNTLKGHQLVHYLHEKYSIDTNTINAELFKAMYEQGKNISLVSTLLDIASDEFNVPQQDKETLANYLENDLGADTVRAEIRSSQHKYDISGVPFFVISNNESRPYGLSGAQSSSSFLNVFQKLSS